MQYSVVVVLFLPLLASAYYMKIGILTHDLGPETTKKIWSMTQNYSTMMSLEPIVQPSQWRGHDAAADISRTVCNLVNRGVDALVFLGPSLGNSFISSYSTHLGLPFITAAENSVDFGKYQVSMLPDTSTAAAQFIIHHGWNQFIFFYDSYDGPDQLQKILQTLASAQFVPEVKGFWKTPDVKTAVLCIRELLGPDNNRRIVLATSEEFADKLASELSRINSFNILLLTPVGTVQIPSIQGQYMYTLTKFSVVDAKDPVLVTLENRLKTLPSFYARGNTNRKNVPDSVVLHYDSSSMLNTMFNQIARENPSALVSRKNLDCLEFSGEIPETANYIKRIFIEHGVTGKIQFNEMGRRINYKLNILHSSPNAVQKIGTWSISSGLQLVPNFPRNPQNPTYAAQRSDPSIKVLGLLVYPFLFVDENGSLRGYFVDFLDELSRELKVNFDLIGDPEGIYGYRASDGEWKGLVGKLIRGETEMAVAPLTKTLERQEVIDFSKTIITCGINIIIKKQESEAGGSTFDPFSFLTVWSPETWVVIVVAVLIYSAFGYGISRFIGAPDRVRALETKGTDNLSPCGSIWLTVGSLFCRDTGIYPRNLTHRLWALLWWIFCIFISLLYVSTLTSELMKVRTTTTQTYSRKSSQEILQDFLETGMPVIGTVSRGSTRNLFGNSESRLYQQIGRFLQDNPDATANSYKEGEERVRKSNGKYAFIMESTSSELIANKDCDILMTSGYLATRHYGLAFSKNSTWKEIIDHGILGLMERGRVRDLYEKWWHSNKTSCEDPNLNLLPKIYNTSVTLHEVSGLFYLFIIFSLLSVAVATLEYYIRGSNITVK